MTEPERLQSSDGGRRRAKRVLSPSQKYEIWIGLLRGEYTTIEAAHRAGVDRTTIMRVRQVAKQGALEALGTASSNCRRVQPRGRARCEIVGQAPGPPLESTMNA